jgi:hypothetical protein
MSNGLNRSICCVCDELVFANDTKNFQFTDNKLKRKTKVIINSMQNRLKVPSNRTWKPINQLLITQYNCINIYSGFEGLMLSCRGMNRVDDKIKFTLCQKCHKSLTYKSDNPEWIWPPKLAIVNGFYMGILPTTYIPTHAEKAMTSLCTFVGQTRVIRGGSRNALRGHVILFETMPAPIHLLILPRLLNPQNGYTVELAGQFTNTQKEFICKQYETRLEVINWILKFYFDNNILYEPYTVDEVLLRNISPTSVSKSFIINEGI